MSRPFVKGNIFVFAKPALLGEPEGQVGTILYFHLYLQLFIFVFLLLFIFVSSCKVGSSVKKARKFRQFSNS